jgi:chitinase
VDGTAKQPSDYKALSGTLSFAPGKTKAWANVWIVGDRTREATESFTLELRSPVGASIGDGSATGTIVNDD